LTADLKFLRTATPASLDTPGSLAALDSARRYFASATTALKDRLALAESLDNGFTELIGILKTDVEGAKDGGEGEKKGELINGGEGDVDRLEREKDYAARKWIAEVKILRAKWMAAKTALW